MHWTRAEEIRNITKKCYEREKGQMLSDGKLLSGQNKLTKKIIHAMQI